MHREYSDDMPVFINTQGGRNLLQIYMKALPVKGSRMYIGSETYRVSNIATVIPSEPITTYTNGFALHDVTYIVFVERLG
jgi:hypothetical protein